MKTPICKTCARKELRNGGVCLSGMAIQLRTGMCEEMGESEFHGHLQICACLMDKSICKRPDFLATKSDSLAKQRKKSNNWEEIKLL